MRVRIVAITALLTLVACSNGSEGPTVGAAFAKRAVAACNDAKALKDAQGPFPYPDFNPTDPVQRRMPSGNEVRQGRVSRHSRFSPPLTRHGGRTAPCRRRGRIGHVLPAEQVVMPPLGVPEVAERRIAPSVGGWGTT
jgi:hypothetical protein